MLQLSLGKRVALATCCPGSQGAQPGLLSFPQDFALKVRIYDSQMSALSELVFGRQSKLIPPNLREGIFSISGEKANHLSHSSSLL